MGLTPDGVTPIRNESQTTGYDPSVGRRKRKIAHRASAIDIALGDSART